jgi:peptide/nickel transport system permease protein
VAGYVARRAVSSLIALFLFLTILFFVIEVMIPGDFTYQYLMTRGARQALQSRLGLDLPLWQRYWYWLRTVFEGGLGRSLYGFPVADYLKTLIPPTLLVFVMGAGIAFLFGQWLGKVTAWRGPGLLHGTSTAGAIALYASFPPWLAYLMTYFFARRLGWFRSVLSDAPFNTQRGVWVDSPLSPQAVMIYIVAVFVAALIAVWAVNKGLERAARRRLPVWLDVLLYLLLLGAGWLGFGLGPQVRDVLSLAALPILTFILLSFGETMLIMRTSMTDTLKEEYITTARAKGLPDPVIRDRHAARNALLPVLSRLVVSLPYLMTGLVIIESALDWPGLSGALFDSLYNQDVPTALGALLVVGVASALARLLLDVVAAYLDPRIRFESGAPGEQR